ncbi:hypothetical protein [Amycolatopsis sp. DSM 110486]|uniref:hypothetical protein n=1 Tax=Amycolatopsis sp. DSM 110486 TaxID=2865832 RepID=UPI001C6A8D30|nr:hypothetical protein [Amycolatopsis sp. DSM 110486]QYN26689.1 hypothetical protein K1T34_52905 [Amycolatopsis sp. DSM 110486]
MKSALDFKETARNNAQVDRLVAAGSRAVDALCHRTFYPEIDTRTFDWPNAQTARPWRLWLDQNDLISCDALVSGDELVPADAVLLRPDNSGPPFTHVEIDIGTSSAFTSGASHQRSISITGLWGYGDDETPAGALAANLDASQTTVDVTNAAAVGVGTLFRVDDERCVVIDKRQLDTGQTLAADLTDRNNVTALAVQDGDAFTPGEVVLVDAERMLVEDIAGDVLLVARAWDGTPLAAHTTGAHVWAARRLVVERAVLGSTPGVHGAGAALTAWTPPPLVRALAIAEAVTSLQQETSAYGRTVGAGENQREASGKGIADLRSQVYAAYGRKARTRAV